MQRRGKQDRVQPPLRPPDCPILKWVLGLFAQNQRRGRRIEDHAWPYQYVTPARVAFDQLLCDDARGYVYEPVHRLDLAFKAFVHDLVVALQSGAERKGDCPEDGILARADRVDLPSLLTERGWSEEQIAVLDRVFKWVSRVLALPFPASIGFLELDALDSLLIACGDETVLEEYARAATRELSRHLRRDVAPDGWRDGIRDVCVCLVPVTLQRVVAELFWYGKEVLHGDDDFYREGEYASRIGLCKHCRCPFVRMTPDQMYCFPGCRKAEEQTYYSKKPRRRKTRAYDSAEELPMVFGPDDAEALLSADFLYRMPLF